MAEALFGKMLQEDLYLHTLSVHHPVSNAESRHKTAQTQNWLDGETNCVCRGESN